MRKLYFAMMAPWVGTLAGCGGEGGVQAASEAAKQVVQSSSGCAGPGWLASLILIIIPIFVILVKLFRESEATSDSLISLEGQLRRLNNKIDDLEAGVKGGKKSE